MALRARCMQSILRPGKDFRHRSGVTRRGHAANRDCRSNRASGSKDRLLAHAIEQPLRRNRQFVRRAIGQNDPELVSGEAAKVILATQPRANTLADLGDDGVAYVKAISFVEMAKVIDGYQQKTAGAAKTHGLVECRTKGFRETNAIKLAG